MIITVIKLHCIHCETVIPTIDDDGSCFPHDAIYVTNFKDLRIHSSVHLYTSICPTCGKEILYYVLLYI